MLIKVPDDDLFQLSRAKAVRQAKGLPIERICYPYHIAETGACIDGSLSAGGYRIV